MEFSNDFTETTLVLSTAHITSQTNEALRGRLNGIGDLLFYSDMDGGYLICPHAYAEAKAEGYGELAHLMQLAVKRGDRWLRLDADARIHDDLPTWSGDVPKFRVTVQYPYTRWYEQEVEVEAANEEAAAIAGIAKANKDWDRGYEVGDGDCGKSEATEVELIAEDETPP